MSDNPKRSFSLKTLLVLAVVMLSNASFSRLVYLNQYARFHDREADKYSADRAGGGNLKMEGYHRQMAQTYRRAKNVFWLPVDESAVPAP